MPSWTFTVPGPPVGKERAGRRTVETVAPDGSRKISARSYTPKATKDYESSIRDYAAGARVTMLDGPVSVSLAILRPQPSSRSLPAKQRAASIRYATGKPDADNILKTVLDALKGVAYKDDTMVARIGVVRLWGEPEGVTISISSLTTQQEKRQVMPLSRKPVPVPAGANRVEKLAAVLAKEERVLSPGKRYRQLAEKLLAPVTGRRRPGTTASVTPVRY